MTVQDNQRINEQITREIRQYFKMNENKTQHIKSYRIQQK